MSLLLLFVVIVLIILRGHTDIGFWYQSDSLFPPHFVHDVIIQHHHIQDWYFSTGTTQLLSVFPQIIFAFFTHNIDAWRLVNTWFLLTLYFGSFLLIGRLLFSNKQVSLLIALSALISLSLLAAFKQIPFTLDMLLVSGQHGELLLLTLVCLILLIIKLKNPSNHWALPLLFVSILLEATSDEILILSFAMPALIILLLFFRQKNNTLHPEQKDSHHILYSMLTIIIAIGCSRLAWIDLPLNYIRQGPTLILGHATIPWSSLYLASRGYDLVLLQMNSADLLHTVMQYLCFMCSSYPFYLTFVFLAFLICSSSGIYGWAMSRKTRYAPNSEQNLLVLVLLFFSLEWLSGIGRLFITRHVGGFFAAHLFHDHLFLHYEIHGFSDDLIDFYVLPLFLGLPVSIGYIASLLKKSQQKKLLYSLNLFSCFLIISLLVYSIHRISHTVTYGAQKKSAEQLMQCLQYQIKQNHLHAGVADYWMYRPIIFLSHFNISLSALSSSPGASHEHYIASWDEISHKNIDFWIARYDRIFSDPDYANYYNSKLDVIDKLKHFGPPDGQFTCHAPDGTWLQVYFYQHDQLMKSLLPSIREEGKSHVYINPAHEISW